MGTRTKVSKQVKVTQGSRAVTFELSKRGLDIEYQTADEATVAGFTLKEPAMDALRELLGLQKPSIVQALEPPKPPIDSDEVRRRFRIEGDTPADARDDTAPDDGSVQRTADGVESGME